MPSKDQKVPDALREIAGIADVDALRAFVAGEHRVTVTEAAEVRAAALVEAAKEAALPPVVHDPDEPAPRNVEVLRGTWIRMGDRNIEVRTGDVHHGPIAEHLWRHHRHLVTPIG